MHSKHSMSLALRWPAHQKARCPQPATVNHAMLLWKLAQSCLQSSHLGQSPRSQVSGKVSTGLTHAWLKIGYLQSRCPCQSPRQSALSTASSGLTLNGLKIGCLQCRHLLPARGRPRPPRLCHPAEQGQTGAACLRLSLPPLPSPAEQNQTGAVCRCPRLAAALPLSCFARFLSTFSVPPSAHNGCGCPSQTLAPCKSATRDTSLSC